MRSKLLTTSICTALALGTMGVPATAGSLADPVVEPEIIVEQTTSSNTSHLIVPALFIAFVAAAMLAPTPTYFSDARLKTDITPVGTAANGLTLYQFRYVGQEQVYEGVLAQEVLAHTPEAVTEIGGYLAVDYGMLGLEMRAIN